MNSNINYNEYILSKIEKKKILFISIILTIVIAFLFYNSPIALIIFFLLYKLVKDKLIEDGKTKRRKILENQFVDALQSISTSILSGYSVENAFKEAENEIEQLHSKKSVMYKELNQINKSVDLNIPLEQLLDDFAQRSGVEEIKNFAEVFYYAKRGSGDFVKIIEKSVSHIRESIDISNEINVLIAAKKYEQKIMSMVPIFIIAYLRVTSGRYLNPLYNNFFGAFFMSICLVAYYISLKWEKKILEIEV
ncbi:type II secretion system F family protein [Lachnobacterium bovis]|uniref:type II secretion system F family protein n=1 Tax=Lachnobacterium bovis TaxID=140626 RepID=UPI0003B749E8|nr:hypothetical protein [Lachnobacterium bovis]